MLRMCLVLSVHAITITTLATTEGRKQDARVATLVLEFTHPCPINMDDKGGGV